MSICDILMFKVESFSVSHVEHYNHASIGFLIWCEVTNGALFSKAAHF